MRLNKPDWLLDKRFISFVLCGGLNTVVTYLLYLLLASVMHYQVAYLIAYTSGIALAYMLNLHLVFNEQSSFRKVVCYPLIYLTQYLLGAGLLYLFVSMLGLSNALAPLLVIVMLLPVSYFMNKKVLIN
jgi:putative flippase GtrA